MLPLLTLTLVTLPSPSNLFADISAWADPIFTDLLPFAILVIGLLLGAALITFMIRGVMYVVHHLHNH